MRKRTLLLSRRSGKIYSSKKNRFTLMGWRKCYSRDEPGSRLVGEPKSGKERRGHRKARGNAMRLETGTLSVF